MAKINKVYPPFFNGVSQQNPELVLDNQCREMINCVPNLVQGLQKRPPLKYVTHKDYATYPEMETARVFHTYDRGEGTEEYIIMETTASASEPVQVYNKAGEKMNVEYNPTNEAAVKAYLAHGNLKGLTVQDRTWVFSKDAVVDLDYSVTTPLKSNYTKEAFYWLKRGSGDRFNPFNYGVYLNGHVIACNPDKPAIGGTDAQDPATGFEDSNYAASDLAAKINAYSDYNASVNGSMIKIWRDGYADFTFSTWDSWGNQASEGWKGSVNKMTDLPKEMPFADTYVKVLGDENNTFTDYFVKWNGSSWEECLDPEADRGQLTNMPVKMDRTALVNGVATFTFDLIDWSLPRVGNIDNNPDPSFLDRQIADIFFYKNRLGIASEDSVSLTEAANYTNFYSTTAVDIVDTDMIDITISTNQASKIYYAKPFNNSLYIFTKYAQYELVSEGIFSPSTVSLSNTTNYPMAIDVEPVVVNDSLYFISTTDNRQQLREYIKSDNLSVKGIDLNVSTPTYLTRPIKKLIADGVLGYVLCCTEEDFVYLYNFVEDGTQRIQSAWSTWELLQGFEDRSSEFFNIGSTVLVVCKTDTDYRYHQLQLDYVVPDDNVDTTWDTTEVIEYPYESSVLLPDYYPMIGDVRTPLNKTLIKKVTIEGEGQFDADVYRKDYDRTYSKTHDKSMRDLDLHVASKVGNVDITIKDSSINDFKISSIVVEGLLTTTSREMR
jgi:hypothetical protein